MTAETENDVKICDNGKFMNFVEVEKHHTSMHLPNVPSLKP
jgi:hypothetical protein